MNPATDSWYNRSRGELEIGDRVRLRRDSLDTFQAEYYASRVGIVKNLSDTRAVVQWDKPGLLGSRLFCEEHYRMSLEVLKPMSEEMAKIREIGSGDNLNPNNLKMGDRVKYTPPIVHLFQITDRAEFFKNRRGVITRTDELGWCTVQWEQPQDAQGSKFFIATEALECLEKAV